MRLMLTICLVALLLHGIIAEESSWSWAKDTKTETKPEDTKPDGTENEEVNGRSLYSDQDFALNDTEIESIIEDILSSTRQGRNLQGYDEVYTDPELQEAIQKGDNTEARNIIKEKLCSLGLMQCPSYNGKRPYFSPDHLIYAQPVALKPVGRPIATVPIRGPIKSPYGPPKPMPFPSQNFGPPRPQGGIPPRRGYGAPFNPNNNNGGYFESHGAHFTASKPPGPVLDIEEPYSFVPPAEINNKEIIVGHTGIGGAQQHVHHHYHHGGPGDKVQTIGSQLHAESAAGVVGGVQSGFNPSNTYGGSYTSHKDVTSATFGSNSGLGSFASGVKPVFENFGAQSFGDGSNYASNFNGQYGSNSFGASVGSYGSSSPFYKKELNLNRPLNGNSLQGAYGQTGYADKYKGFESIRSDNYDCVCVPYDQCPQQDIIGRKEDFYLPLDPRNLKSDIEAISEQVVVTDGNGNMTVVRVPKELSKDNKQSEEPAEETKKVVKREASEDNDEQSKSEKSKVEPVSCFFHIYLFPPESVVISTASINK